MPDFARALVRAVSHIVPSHVRREFRDEWEAELSARGADSAPAHRHDSFRRAIGAVPDAFFLFSQQWSIDMLSQDVRYALRVLAQRRAYTALAVATLAIGIGATTAVFSAIDAVLLRPLPFRDPARLVHVWENDRIDAKPRYPVAPANWVDWRTATSRSFEHMVAYLEGSGGSLSSGGEPFHASIPVVACDFFDAFGVRPLLGRTFEAADAVPPRHRILVLSFRTWQTRFGADPQVIGRTVKYNGVDYRIVGVMPEAFEYPSRDVDAWRPLGETPQMLQTRAQHFLGVVGRVRDEPVIPEAFLPSTQDVNGDMQLAVRTDGDPAALTGALREVVREVDPSVTIWQLRTLDGIVDEHLAPRRLAMLVVEGFAGVALGLALLGIYGVLSYTVSQRVPEIGVRMALGAQRTEILRQSIADGLRLALPGVAIGIATAAAVSRLVRAVLFDVSPTDPASYAVLTIGVLVVAALACYLPARRASRVDPLTAIRN